MACAACLSWHRWYDVVHRRVVDRVMAMRAMAGRDNSGEAGVSLKATMNRAPSTYANVGAAPYRRGPASSP